MKKILVSRLLPALLLLLLPLLAHGVGTDVNLKWGSPTQEELEMTRYNPDPEATAVVLCTTTDVHYECIANDFKLITTVKNRIKVLSDDGKDDAANHKVVFRYNNNHPGSRELVRNIKGTTYNLVGGKVEKTKLENSMISYEDIDKTLRLMKLTMPRVTKGSVIEYEYTLESDFYLNLRDWDAQGEIPVAYTSCDVTIPEWFIFNVDVVGHQHLENKVSVDNLTFYLTGAHLTCRGNRYQFTGRYLPALRKESLSYSRTAYSQKVMFELMRINFPGRMVKNFSTTWADIDKHLLDDEDFGGRYKKNPLHKEMEAAGIIGMSDREARLHAIVDLLRSKVKWNQKYSLMGSPAAKVLKDGSGTNTDINFLLIAMLNDAGITALPAVLRTRDEGAWLMTRPSLRNLSTTVVIIPDESDPAKFRCFDGSVEWAGLDVLPETFLCDKARGITPGREELWYNLEDKGKSVTRCIINGSIDDSGLLTATRKAGYQGKRAESFREKYHNATDSAHYVQNLENEDGIQIQSYTLEGVDDLNAQVAETMTFTRQCEATGDHIYFRPLVFSLLSESPLKSEKRYLPVEFPCKTNITIASKITIPQGWTVEEIPQPISLTIEDNSFTIKIVTTQSSDNTIDVVCRMTTDRLLYAPEEYPMLKSMLDEIVKHSTDVVVLSKLP